MGAPRCYCPFVLNGGVFAEARRGLKSARKQPQVPLDKRDGLPFRSLVFASRKDRNSMLPPSLKGLFVAC